MPERDPDSESSQPRKRIAVAVSSTETPLKDQEFGYNIDASRTFQARTTPLNSHYPGEIPAGDVMAYRQGSYPYGSKSCYSGVSGWTSTYPEDGVEYVNYPPYQMMGQDTVHMIQSYGRYGPSKPVYVDPETSAYSYGNLVHRPAASNDSANFSLSGMADSLPNTSARVVPSDRLLPQVTRAMTNSSYRTDGLPGQYPSKATASHAASPSTVPDAYSVLNASFDSPVSYAATGTFPSNISHRSATQSDSTSYQPSSSSASDTIYNTSDQSLRPTDEAGAGLSYIYSDRDSVRRDSQSSGAASTLSNGHVYVPESHHHAHASAQGYVVSGASASQGAVIEGATTAPTRSGHSGSSHLHSESHRRSAGSLRGGG
ncbi:hypothetical protein DL766_009290 [Monosporascus sp. MC13-8B]|uniref:Uncharacterized protein n=1 Tax=Monosporascus cannonballus TaxID=155416 RepID=A0ABY0HDT3_9PEZI|nr:hypothetical protein DL762_002536 [Monosporascus cannonballus]RYO97922.1 hypothetical protein DL763_002522 [Monosporascus cannonballus]RYP15866.1 hypothetical protein DL766_009290 [Monosporascus sp. MC13-8B]